ncbi:UDP-N-acetylglucosamine 2-epimerase (EC [Olavius sp. associated proteobacterium Delta 1]|nr:UDP-N-acetylglucosamine 2-epimerase (EC [Olavius sp. associated proteobacterium Delta 1]
MNKKKHICFFTGKRGGFTHLIPIIELIAKKADFSYSIIASDMHLSKFFGNTIEEVHSWVGNVYPVETLMYSSSKLARAKSIGIGILGISELLAQIKPDFVFILGDRGEVLGMAICALEMNIPIIHLFGGDVTQGGVDEPVRHAITKLATIHLTSNKESADRVLKMGEEPWRVHVVGSPVLDLIKHKRFTPPEQIIEKFDLNLDNPVILLLQHSVTWQVEDAEYQIRQTMAAIDQLGFQTIAVYPCADPGYEKIIEVLQEYEQRSYFQLYNNIEFSDYWGLMNVAGVFVGNSSAGVMETPSFHLPFVNIGIRQEDRLRADNVIDSDHDKNQIAEAIQTALTDNEFRNKVSNCKSPYGDGTAADRIVSILSNLQKNQTIIRKKITF